MRFRALAEEELRLLSAVPETGLLKRPWYFDPKDPIAEAVRKAIEVE